MNLRIRKLSGHNADVRFWPGTYTQTMEPRGPYMQFNTTACGSGGHGGRRFRESIYIYTYISLVLEGDGTDSKLRELVSRV